MAEYQIDTPMRAAAFIAQVSSISGNFFILREIAIGQQTELDIGRGLLHIHGKRVYDLCGKALGADFISHPQLLEEHPNSSRSAAWYWSDYLNLNPLADDGNIKLITQILSYRDGGMTGRLLHYNQAKRELGLIP